MIHFKHEIYEFSFFQSFISADPLSEQINTITIFEILKEASDTTWRRKKFNKSFINVSCELFIKCPQYLREDKIEVNIFIK